METPFRDINTRNTPRKFCRQAEWQAYAQWLRRQVKVSLGLLPEPPRCQLKAKIFGRWAGDGYTCEKVYFESLPGFYVTGNLYRPTERRRRQPGILSAHGHWPEGRLHDYDPHGGAVLRCLHLARQGYTVFAYDMIGYNDSCQLKIPHCRRDFDYGALSEPLWGLSLMALQTWNSIRALDFLADLPEVDPRRLGMTGESGGGTQTFILSAVDDRLAAAAPICMVSALMQGGCYCENAPLLRLDQSNVEIAELFAPKPLFLGSCTRDWTQETRTLEGPAIRAVYKLYGQAKALSGAHVDDDHNYNQEMREAVYGFFNHWFNSAKSVRPIREGHVRFPPRPPLRDRLVWYGREAPAEMTFAELKALWRKSREAALRPALKSASRDLGPLLEHVLGLPDSGLPASGEGLDFRQEGEVLLVESRGVAKLPPAPAGQFFNTYNRGFGQERVIEILRALQESGARALDARGAAGLWGLLAAGVSDRYAPRLRRLTADLDGFDPDSDADWTQRCDIPGLRQIGGLAPALARMARLQIELKNAPAKLRRSIWR